MCEKLELFWEASCPFGLCNCGLQSLLAEIWRATIATARRRCQVSLEPFGGKLRFSIAPEFDAACLISEEFVAGEVYHVERNQIGGGIFTPVARFFAWWPDYIENYHDHWRVDCFVMVHELSPQPKKLSLALARGLLRESICSEPLWVSWHRSKELGGKDFGEVFDLD